MKSDIDKAINILRQEYEKALKQSWIKNPLAYALYHTWKYIDERGGVDE